MTPPDENPSSAPRVDLGTDRAHPARVYDYWLGGKENFAPDRELGDWMEANIFPMRDYARSNRLFLARAVRLLAESGVTQFLDIGSGLPTKPNVHEVAQSVRPKARVVYVDNDPIVAVHARALLAADDSTIVTQADLLDVDAVLDGARRLLDFEQPIALMFVATLHHVPDEDDPAGAVARYLSAMPRGSHLVLSHVTGDGDPDKADEGAAEATRRGAQVFARTHAQILGLFHGLPLMEPGLVPTPEWRPDGTPGPARSGAYGGIATIG